MGTYAAETSVSCEKSRMEIEQTLRRYKAEKFGYADLGDRAIIGFQMCGRVIRFALPVPDRAEFKTHLLRGQQHNSTPDRQQRDWEQACRQRWRALALVIKAKLEAVECGITLFEEEFLAHIVLPNGQTFGEYAIPQIAKAYETRDMPPLLTFGGGPQ